VFGAVMRHQDAPGTTFKRHMAIARGLMSEDDYLLTEIMFNPHSPRQLKLIQEQLAELSDIVEHRDSERMHTFINRVRANIK
jgi:prephenate dehydrogenase